MSHHRLVSRSFTNGTALGIPNTLGKEQSPAVRKGGKMSAGIVSEKKYGLLN